MRRMRIEGGERERGKERESEVDLFPLANLVQNVLNATLFLNINPSSNLYCESMYLVAKKKIKAMKISHVVLDSVI